MSINNIRSVFPKSLSIFPVIDFNNEFIQFESGGKKNEPDLVFIWDLTTNKAVETLD
jgi:hypothetical protein